MVSINYSSREVCCKIVYYGPGLSGKTTNLQYVHSKVPPNTRGKLISLATEADRTLYFDFLPINIGTINGFAAKFQLYTVPGQVYYNATRKLVLRGVDGLVFVADSQPDKMEENIESLVNLEENLKEYGYDLRDLPMVIQYNKRDLPGVLPAELLNARLNAQGWPHFEASATIGNGVFDTLKLIIKMVLDKAKSSSVRRPAPVSAEPHTCDAASAADSPPALGAPSQPRPQRPETVTVAAAAPSCSVPPSKPAGSVSEATVPEVASAVTKETAARQDRPQPTVRQVRPYPGSETEEAGHRKITPTTFSALPRQEKPETEIDRKVMTSEGAEREAASARATAPTMAPAVRRRTHKKKRGFFKRLFGIR